MYGLGIGVLKAMGATLRQFFRKPFTIQYPEERMTLAPRVRGIHIFDESKCIVCTRCARACPHGNIIMNVREGPNGERELLQYDLDMGYCLFCGLCTDACPTGAIVMSPRYELAGYSREDLIYTAPRWSREVSGKPSHVEVLERG
ncbi:MAG: NADH-quinone oxidoreductase subunit I [Chloroflexi bacterium]|nr:NADH-quinone oxidoreductase subunit I [Chloroflexota bacterium]